MCRAMPWADMHRESRMLTSISTRISIGPCDSVLATRIRIGSCCELKVQVGLRAYVVSHFFGHDLTSGDFAVYVLPEHRKGHGWC
jgi:hypothetical protein